VRERVDSEPETGDLRPSAKWKFISFQIFPRFYALAEVLWTNPAVRDYADLEHRISARTLP
jgi:N-acetyl-beta-hexosaminidase